MNTKQKIALGVIAGATVLTGLYGVSSAHAATTTNDLPPVIQKIVEKYHLNKDEVKTLVDQDRTERQAERAKRKETRLAELVSAGKITEAQKVAILAKEKELEAKREEYKNLSGAERKTKMEAMHAEMQAFLKSQGIDESVMPGPIGKGKMGRGMHRDLD
jgi:hypothetical protein